MNYIEVKMNFMSRQIRNRRCIIFVLFVSLCALVTVALLSSQRNLPSIRYFYSRDRMIEERTLDHRKLPSGLNLVEHIVQLDSYNDDDDDDDKSKRMDNFTLHLQNDFNFKEQVVDAFDTPREYSKKQLWGCYKYKEGQLGLSREKADANALKKLNCGKKLPAAWIIGVKKCGSQMLSALLDLHPQVVSSVSSIFVGENDEALWNKRAFIERHLPFTTPDEIAVYDMVGLQSQVHTLRHVVENLTTPDTLFLLILVDPVKRALSDYVHCTVKMKALKNAEHHNIKKQLVWNVKSEGSSLEIVDHFKGYRIAKSFEKSVLNSSGKVDVDNPLINKGLYVTYIQEILKIIPKEKLFIVDGKSFVSEPWVTMRQVEIFLKLSPFFSRKHFRKTGDFFCPVLKERPDAGCLKGKGRSKPKVDVNVVRKLYNFYRPFNRKLKTLTNIDFSWM